MDRIVLPKRCRAARISRGFTQFATRAERDALAPREGRCRSREFSFDIKEREGCRNAKDHPIFVVRYSGRGGGTFLRFDFQQLKDCEYYSLWRRRARA